MITRVQNKRRSSYSYANDVMTPSRRNINRLVADEEEEMIVKNNNNPLTPVRVTTSSAAAASSNDEMKEPAATTTSASSSSTINNIGPSTPGRMMVELSKRIRSFHHSTSRNEDSRDDTNNNNSNNSEDYEIHYQYSTDPLDIQQRSHDDSSDDDDTKSKDANFTAISTTVSNKKNNFNNNKTHNSSSNSNNNTTHHRQRYFIEDEIKRFELFRTVIQHEDDLLNQRVSWIILAQSFLMAAVFTSEKGDFGEESNGLKYITAGLGITTIIITMPSILAAGRNIELQQRVYFRGISSEERCYELHGHGRDHHKIQDGELEKRYRYGHVFPNMAFRGRGALPILNVVLMLAVAQICGWVLFLLAIIYGW